MRARQSLMAFAALLGLGAIGAALVSQYVFDMQPCPWCVLQRAIFAAIGIAALIGLVLRRLGAAMVLLLSLSGAAAALWQHFVAANSLSCNLTLADRIVSGLGLDSLLPQVFAAYASCADAAVKLFGLPYEFWSLGLFVLLAVTAGAALRARR